MMKLNSRHIIGIRVDDVTMEETVKLAEYFIEERMEPGIIVTLNPARFLLALHDEEYKDIINSSKLVVDDGIGISIAAKILGVCLRERVTGAALVYKVAELSSKKSYRIYVLGAKKGIAEKAAGRLSRLYPDALFVGTHHGYFKGDSEEEKKILDEIRRLKPQILITALGAPMDEKWLSKHIRNLQVPIGIGVGAGIDFAAKRVKRAPRWMQKIGLEWLFRLLEEPGRLWKRYIIGNLFFLLVILKFKFFGK